MAVCVFTGACAGLEPAAPGDDELLDGPVEGLTSAQNARHLAGDIAFNDDVFTPDRGLGPLFVATSCGSCHPGDGRGHPFTTLTRFGQTDETGNRFLSSGGPQLQHRAIPGYLPESIPAGAAAARFLPPGNTGLGFLELVPDDSLLALADPDDADGDGISGIPNWIVPPSYLPLAPGTVVRNGRVIGRFGRKASVHTLFQQTVNAYNQDIGIASAFDPVDTHSLQEVDPEISTATIGDVVFYLQTLKVPPRRDAANPSVLSGERIFSGINCSGCHTPRLRTGPSPVVPLSGAEIAPYSDLLLHDMGSGLDDGYTEGSARTSEWRTPPLWGLGLARNSQGGATFLLHDGRARSIEEAILLHGGEAAPVVDRYRRLTQAEQQYLIRFLESL